MESGRERGERGGETRGRGRERLGERVTFESLMLGCWRKEEGRPFSLSRHFRALFLPPASASIPASN